MNIETPANIEIIASFQQLRIVIKWFSLKFIFITFFAVIWNSYIISWYLKASSSKDFFSILLPLTFLFIGFGLMYYLLAGYVNKTIIDVNFNSLTVRHEPIPFWGTKVSSKTLMQLYCKKYGHRHSIYQSYEVHAITIDRKSIKLITGLDSKEQAFFIKQEIEKFLRIE